MAILISRKTLQPWLGLLGARCPVLFDSGGSRKFQPRLFQSANSRRVPVFPHGA